METRSALENTLISSLVTQCFSSAAQSYLRDLIWSKTSETCRVACSPCSLANLCLAFIAPSALECRSLVFASTSPRPMLAKLCIYVFTKSPIYRSLMPICCENVCPVFSRVWRAAYTLLNCARNSFSVVSSTVALRWAKFAFRSFPASPDAANYDL